MSTAKVAFVTGARSGTDAAVARRLAARGASVALFDLSEEGVEATAADIGAGAGRALPLEGDVGNDCAVERAVTTAVAELGGLTTAVSCAGIAVPDTVLDLPIADWERTLTMNITGVSHTASTRSADHRVGRWGLHRHQLGRRDVGRSGLRRLLRVQARRGPSGLQPPKGRDGTHADTPLPAQRWAGVGKPVYRRPSGA